ncbi:sensor histidine kinase [Glycomyces xiaoerkulensis]|uniref:sensor histidine kinase n=1 Tax=Glycomyces xiaoerkulensis TaxID=2038139 RepID=UPI000C260CC2|nr:histidine kinase [Glycomyces xiaoerkulensis]
MSAHRPPRLHRRTLVDAATAVVLAVLTATGLFGSSDFFGPSLFGFAGRIPPPWPGVPLGAAVGLLAWQRRRIPVVFLLGALAVNAVVPAHAAVMVAIYTLAERTASWAKVAVGASVAVVVTGAPIWRYAGPDGAIPIGIAVCLAPALIGMYVATRRELLERTRERAERAERDQAQRIAQARSEERAHIARDMHDVVTHRVSLMVLHATALEATEGADAARIGSQIGATGREALNELRSLVEVLRRDGDAPLAPQPGIADLEALVEQSRRLGTPVTLEVVDEVGERPPLLVEHAIYRVAQEALANVHKHAPDARTRVRVRHAPDGLRLSIANGRGRPVEGGGLPGGGHGLLGLAERVRLVGGEFAAEPTADGGFEVVATVPRAEEDGYE